MSAICARSERRLVRSNYAGALYVRSKGIAACGGGGGMWCMEEFDSREPPETQDVASRLIASSRSQLKETGLRAVADRT